MLRPVVVLLSLFTCLVLGPATGGEPKAPPAERKSPLTTHVLNTAIGKPAAGLDVRLERQAEKGWEELGRSRTDEDGKVADLYPPAKPFVAGVYRLVFDTGSYFKDQRQKTFFPRVEVLFQVEKTDEHYHVPLLLSPFGYSTYRGS